MSTRAWRERNREKIAAASRLRYERDREEILARNRAWSEANPDQHADLIRGWAQRNPQRIAAASRRYYQRHREEVLARKHARRTAPSALFPRIRFSWPLMWSVLIAAAIVAAWRVL